MDKLYMGLDIGNVVAKGVIIDKNDNIITSSYRYILGEPIDTTKEVIRDMIKNIDFSKYKIVSIGVTGLSRKLIGLLLGANTIKNEVTSCVKGVLRRYEDTRMILEIGGKNAKIIYVNKNIERYNITDSNIGNMIDIIRNKYDISLDEMNRYDIGKKIDIINKGNMFLLDDTTKKIGEGYRKKDVIYSLLEEISNDYLKNISNIKEPIVLIGGCSNNKIITSNIEKILGQKVIVFKNNMLMGAIGIAIMGKDSGIEKEFNMNMDEINLDIRVNECLKCNNKCNLVMVYKNNNLIDYWGNKCEKELY